jgi:hypothetical protein
MSSGQVKPMLADVVQANTHIDALIGCVVMRLYRLEGGPRAILPRQVHCCRGRRYDVREKRRPCIVYIPKISKGMPLGASPVAVKHERGAAKQFRSISHTFSLSPQRWA